MAAIPLIEEVGASASSTMVGELAGLEDEAERAQMEASSANRPTRKLAIYAASAGFDLVEELDHLVARAIEPNVFFNPRFLAPAMPRLEDREVRLAVIRDDTEVRSRLRLLVPFSVEKLAAPFGPTVMRTWSNPYGPLGTPLVDCDDPAGVVEDFFGMLARPHLNLPKVFVLPETRLDGPFAATLRAVAEARNLPLVTVDKVERAFLKSDLDGEAYLRRSLRAHHYRDFRRLRRRVAEHGQLEHRIARQPEEIREALETFLVLEAAGWKGRERTAMAVDRYLAAFAREAVHRLAERDLCRIHMLMLEDKPVACVVNLVESGVAYTWKTAYDENYAAYSPGTLLMLDITKSLLEDPNIEAADSCSQPDHPVMDRLWSERLPIGTFVIGLTPLAERQVQRAARRIQLYRDTRKRLGAWRDQVRRMIRRR